MNRSPGHLLLLLVAAVLAGPVSADNHVLAAAVLPASRSTETPGALTAFATVINSGATAATGCRIELASGLPLTLGFQTTDPLTNAVTGTADTPVTIGAGASQSFVFSLTTSSVIDPVEAEFSFICDNAGPAGIIPGVNTLLVSASATPVPDVVALAATESANGILALAEDSGAFSVATVNLGSSDDISVSVDTGSATLPLTVAVCETEPVGGTCMSNLAASIDTTIAANATPTFSVFTTASDTVPLDAAANRIFVRFVDSAGQVRGATSVAIEGGLPPVVVPAGAPASALAVVDRVMDLLGSSGGSAGSAPAAAVPSPLAIEPVDETFPCGPNQSVRFVGTLNADVVPATLVGTMTFVDCDTIDGVLEIDSTVRIGRDIDVSITMDGTVAAAECEAINFVGLTADATATPIGIITSPIIATGNLSGTCAGQNFQCNPMGIDIEDDDAFAASCQ